MMIEVNIIWWAEPMQTKYYDSSEYNNISENLADWFDKGIIRGFRIVDHRFKPAKIVAIGYHN